MTPMPLVIRVPRCGLAMAIIMLHRRVRLLLRRRQGQLRMMGERARTGGRGTDRHGTRRGTARLSTAQEHVALSSLSRLSLL